MLDMVDANGKFATISFGIMFITGVVGLLLASTSIILMSYCWGIAAMALASGIVNQQIAKRGIEEMKRLAISGLR